MVRDLTDMNPDEFRSHVYSTFEPPAFAEGEFKEWVDDMVIHGTSYNTAYLYAETTSDFLKFIKKDPRTVTDADIKAYAQYLQSQGKAAYTVQNYLVRLGSFLKWLGVNVNIYRYAPRVDAKIPEYLTLEEVDKFLNAIDVDVVDDDEEDPELAVMRFKTLFALLADTGLRASEACNLTKIDVDFNERLIIVRRGKRRKYRQVPATQRVLSLLRKYWAMRKDNAPFVFEYKGKKLDRMVIWRMTKKIAKKAGIDVRTRTHGPSIYPHIFRHTFATNELKRLIKSGKGRMDALLIIKETLGHADIKTTLIYLTLLGEDIRDMMGR